MEQRRRHAVEHRPSARAIAALDEVVDEMHRFAQRTDGIAERHPALPGDAVHDERVPRSLNISDLSPSSASCAEARGESAMIGSAAAIWSASQAPSACARAGEQPRHGEGHERRSSPARARAARAVPAR